MSLRWLPFRALRPARQYPRQSAVYAPNPVTLDFIRQTKCQRIAEVGIYEGRTSLEIARYLAGNGMLHLFDYEGRVAGVVDHLHAAGFVNVRGFGCSDRLLDSYNWPLMRLLESTTEPLYDYVYLDGAHTWGVDALAFFLLDRLLAVGGYIDFDDYTWNLRRSPTMNPKAFPATARLYTAEQIDTKQVKLVVDLLVRRDARYVEVVPDKVFQKIS